jgi:hypothetical protein
MRKDAARLENTGFAALFYDKEGDITVGGRTVE